MNRLNNKQQTQIISCLVEGNSIRSTSRITGFAKGTVLKLLVDIGRACSVYQDKAFRNLSCKRIQCDEIWSFVGSKAKNTTDEIKKKGKGDAWTWVAMDADTKLIPCWLVGIRDSESARDFIMDLSTRITGRVQLTSDGLPTYLEAVRTAFGSDIDYGMLIKIYGKTKGGETRFSQCIGSRKTVISGSPAEEHISTSFLERQNLSMRMGMRRFTRLTNAFSKKVENHEHAVALHFMYYNFVRVHQTLRVSPAMAAGVTERLWSTGDIVNLLGVSN